MSFKQHEDQQLRVDPADGKAYPLDSFLEVYGEDEGHWGAGHCWPAACPHRYFSVDVRV
jgi:hypothetical protein